MSLINDALKQARQTPPAVPSRAAPTLPPVIKNAVSKYFWLVPASLGVLFVFAVGLILWATLHKMNGQPTTAVAPEVQPEIPVVATPDVPPPPAPEPVPADSTPLPALQGIFYSPTAPLAILDGKTVGVGDQFHEYRVKTISKSTVILVGPDGKPIRLTMSN